eukprot:2566042-Rhodomonas_salina.2
MMILTTGRARQWQQLLPHQERGVRWILQQEKHKGHGGILADEMGLGKTLVSYPSQMTRGAVADRVAAHLVRGGPRDGQTELSVCPLVDESATYPSPVDDAAVSPRRYNFYLHLNARFSWILTGTPVDQMRGDARNIELLLAQIKVLKLLPPQSLADNDPRKVLAECNYNSDLRLDAVRQGKADSLQCGHTERGPGPGQRKDHLARDYAVYAERSSGADWFPQGGSSGPAPRQRAISRTRAKHNSQHCPRTTV